MDTSVSSGLLAIVATAGGVTISFLFQSFTMKRQLKDEDQRRWLANKRESYARLYGVLDEFLRELRPLVDDLLPSEPAGDYVRSAIKRRQRTTRELWPKVLVSLAALDLLASQDVRTAAHQVADAVGSAYNNASRDQDGAFEALVELQQLDGTSVPELVALMRSDLGVAKVS